MGKGDRDMEAEEDRKTRIVAQTMIAAKKDQGIYQQDVAWALGVSASTLSKYLRGKLPLPHDFRERIIRVLGIKKNRRKAALHEQN
jgi:transcriptional regulator with XRE-family HTH domain